MPLSSVNFVPVTGSIKAADMLQFYNLFTGVMTDQPVTFGNTLTVGGAQAVGSSPLRIGGVIGQTANMLEVRGVSTDVQPAFAVGPTGALAWGPGGAVGTDVSLSRSAANQLTVAGVPGTPAFVVSAGGLQVTAGNVGIGAAPGTNIGLLVQENLSSAGGSANVAYLGGTLTSTQAVSDQLYHLQIAPSMNLQSHTGFNAAGLLIGTGSLTNMGGANGSYSALLISNFGGGANINYGIQVGQVGGAGNNNYGVRIQPASGGVVDNVNLYVETNGAGGTGKNLSLYVAGPSRFDAQLQAAFGASPVASTGAIGLANNQYIMWRNAANNGNDALGFDGSDRLIITGGATGGASAATGSFPAVINGVARNVLFF